MTKIDIISGFLGAGKTTLIKKLISEAYAGEKVVLIENEFGEIGIDGGFLADAGIEITEMNSGCICCSLVGDFSKALEKVISELEPDRIIIEPSGVGKLSDVISAVEGTDMHGATLGGYATVVDAKKCKMYMKNFGEFFGDQVESANAIILSHTKGLSDDKTEAVVDMLKERNPKAVIVTTEWDEINGRDILSAMEKASTLSEELSELMNEAEHHHHHHDHGEECTCGCHDHDHHEHEHEHEHEHHHHHDHGEECTCGCHDHDHEHEHEHEHHHHHDHGEECTCGCHDHDHEHEHEHEHHHHHDHGEECTCGCHDHDHEHEHEHDHHHHHHDHGEECTCGCHDHHHHHHADEVFTSWGRETAKTYSASEIETILEAFDSGKLGMILRAKGIIAASDGEWIYFDYVPGEADIRRGAAAVTGKLCVIGSKIDEKKIEEIFGL